MTCFSFQTSGGQGIEGLGRGKWHLGEGLTSLLLGLFGLSVPHFFCCPELECRNLPLIPVAPPQILPVSLALAENLAPPTCCTPLHGIILEAEVRGFGRKEEMKEGQGDLGHHKGVDSGTCQPFSL